MQDRWASGDLYDPYVGRWSRLVAREFLVWLNPPAALNWLDLGCGTARSRRELPNDRWALPLASADEPPPQSCFRTRTQTEGLSGAAIFI